MNMLAIQNGTQAQTMSSVDIAELTGKQHKNVMRDIDKMFEELGQLKSEPSSSYINSQNKSQPCYNLDKEMTLTLVSGYNVKLRHAIIKRWQELEDTQFRIPQSLPEALQLAADQAKLLEEQRPAVEFVEKYVDASGNKTFREVCKLLKVNERKFRYFLVNTGVMYRLNGAWTAYAQHLDAGRLKTFTNTFNDRNITQLYFTPKGVEWIIRFYNEQKGA